MDRFYLQNIQHGFVCRNATAMTTPADIECRAVTSTGQGLTDVTVHAPMHACIFDFYTSTKYYVTDVIFLCFSSCSNHAVLASKLPIDLLPVNRPPLLLV